MGGEGSSKIKNSLNNMENLFKKDGILDQENDHSDEEENNDNDKKTSLTGKLGKSLKITINKESEEHELTQRKIGFSTISRKRSAKTEIEIDEEMELEIDGKKNRELEKEIQEREERRKSKRRKVPDRPVYRPRRAIENEEKIDETAAKILKNVKKSKKAKEKEIEQLLPKIITIYPKRNRKNLQTSEKRSQTPKQ